MTDNQCQPDVVVDAPTPQEQIAWWEEQYSRQAVKIERLTTERDQLLSALKNAPQCGVQTEEAIADAIDNARYQHPDHPRERPRPFAEADRTDMTAFVPWLRGLAEQGGKGVVGNIDARCLGRVADDLERLHRRVAALENIIAEDLPPWNCRDELNKMLVDEIWRKRALLPLTGADVGGSSK